MSKDKNSLEVAVRGVSYTAEKAKSSRSSCKKCKETIVKDSIRLSAVEVKKRFSGSPFPARYNLCLNCGKAVLIEAHNNLKSLLDSL